MQGTGLIVASSAVAAIVAMATSSSRAFAVGEGASQKWVALKIAQSESNTVAKVEKRLAEFSVASDAAIDAVVDRLGDTNETYTVEQAIADLSVDATPTVTAIFDSVVTLAPSNADREDANSDDKGSEVEK